MNKIDYSCQRNAFIEEIEIFIYYQFKEIYLAIYLSLF